MKVYDLLWKREEKSEENKSEEKKNGKIRWENVGVLIENEGKRSVKLNLCPGRRLGRLAHGGREKREARRVEEIVGIHIIRPPPGLPSRSRTIAIWRLK